MSTQATDILRGRVAHLFYSSPGFCAGKLSDGFMTFNFAGKIYVRQDELVALRGSWIDHQKYGEQFQAVEVVYEDDLSPEGLAWWLANCNAAKGIGPVKAEKIAREFAADFGQVLEEEPQRIAEVAGIPLEKVRALAKDWASRREFNNLATQLAVWELTRHQIESLVGKFGGSVLKVLQDDPYAIMGQVDGFGFRRADDIAKKLGVPKDHPSRIRAAIRYSVEEFLDRGYTLVPASELHPRIDHNLVMDTREEVEAAYEFLGELVKKNELAIPHATPEPHYAIPWIVEREEFVRDFLRGLSDPHPRIPSTSIPQLVSTHGEELDGWQSRAVATAIRYRGALVTGGAGSGKTFCVKALVRICKALRLRVELCAPTGKAARRMEQVIPGVEAQTIHRLLQYRPGSGFRMNAEKQLKADVVIVDEVSMVDIPLAHALFSAIGPRTSVVLVGDHHQLPPVGPGNLLRDCYFGKLLPITELEHCHRQAGPLKLNCSGILTGEVAKTVRPAKHPGPWYVHDKLNEPEQVAECVGNLFAEILPRFNIDPISDTQFLTPIHRGELGTRSLNILLQRIRQRQQNVEVPPVADDERPRLYPGDKVIQTKNDYDLDLMNGHQGVVIRTRPLLVRFDGRTVDITPEKEKNIELAYCLTPHKCQGSEWPCIVVVCHKLHSFSHHQNWLYTSCTRAQQVLILLGDSWAIRSAAKKLSADARKTLLQVAGK